MTLGNEALIQKARAACRQLLRKINSEEGAAKPVPATTTNGHPEWMFEVRVKRRYLIEGKSVWKLVAKKVEDVARNESNCCVHCGAEVRLYQGTKVRWHAEHKHAIDASKCPGGITGEFNSRPRALKPAPVIAKKMHIVD